MYGAGSVSLWVTFQGVSSVIAWGSSFSTLTGGSGEAGGLDEQGGWKHVEADFKTK